MISFLFNMILFWNGASSKLFGFAGVDTLGSSLSTIVDDK
jgi:hypothetical protein